MPNARDDFAIRHVASLARLRLTADEEVLYGKQLGEILAYATDVLRIDADSAPATSPSPTLPTPLRGDLVRPSLPGTTVLENAPEHTTADRLFHVPRVIG
jgi:aspartyl-tRNA(Asn)/glutamyl-tRNA(Gln) amidotransferase subunit C